MSHSARPLTLRLAGEADAPALRRLAQLDSSTPPSGLVLLAERDGALVAARSLSDARTVADPFVPTGDAVRLLAARAAQLTAPDRRRPGGRTRALVPRAAA